MATFTPAPVVATIRGTIGGVVFSAARSGTTIRARTSAPFASRPRQPFDYQQFGQSAAYMRAQFSVLSDYWHATLTQPQRDGWDALATTTHLINRLGMPFRPTGRNLFLRTNTVATLFGGPIEDTAPALAICQMPVPTLTWDAILSRFTLSATPLLISGDSQVFTWVSPPRNVTRNVHTSPYYLHSAPDLNHLPAVLANSAHETGWRLCRAYFFRFRTLAPDGALSHSVTVRALSCA